MLGEDSVSVLDLDEFGTSVSISVWKSDSGAVMENIRAKQMGWLKLQ